MLCDDNSVRLVYLDVNSSISVIRERCHRYRFIAAACIGPILSGFGITFTG